MHLHAHVRVRFDMPRASTHTHRRTLTYSLGRWLGSGLGHMHTYTQRRTRIPGRGWEAGQGTQGLGSGQGRAAIMPVQITRKAWCVIQMLLFFALDISGKAR